MSLIMTFATGKSASLLFALGFKELRKIRTGQFRH